MAGLVVHGEAVQLLQTSSKACKILLTARALMHGLPGGHAHAAMRGNTCSTVPRHTATRRSLSVCKACLSVAAVY